MQNEQILENTKQNNPTITEVLPVRVKDTIVSRITEVGA